MSTRLAVISATLLLLPVAAVLSIAQEAPRKAIRPRKVLRLPDPEPAPSSPRLAALLGKNGRERHAERLEQARVDGAAHSWDQYSRWGLELFRTGQVEKPPTGPSPSDPLSPFYRCVDCHNNQREDRILTSQDPDMRVEWIESLRVEPAPAGAHPLFLAPGTTLWGAVHRESFYNDSFAVYHSLIVTNDRPMDPTSLEDATQVCCKYCSVGRLAEEWEINSLLAYFWDLEIRLDDLDLPAKVSEAVVRVLGDQAAQDPAEVEQPRQQRLVRTQLAPTRTRCRSRGTLALARNSMPWPARTVTGRTNPTLWKEASSWKA
jgi:hypothetical protein